MFEKLSEAFEEDLNHTHIEKKASEVSGKSSYSLVKRQKRETQANVRSTTQHLMLDNKTLLPRHSHIGKLGNMKSQRKLLARDFHISIGNTWQCA